MGLVVSLSSAKGGRDYSVLPCRSSVRGTAIAWAATFGTSLVVLPATFVEVKVSSVDEKELLPREICVLFVAKIQPVDLSELNGKGRDVFVSDGIGSSPLNGMLFWSMNSVRQSLIDGIASTNFQVEMNAFNMVLKNRGEVDVGHHLFGKMPHRTVFVLVVFGDIEGGDKKGGESMDCSYCSEVFDNMRGLMMYTFESVKCIGTVSEGMFSFEIGNQDKAGSENCWLDNPKMCDNWKGTLFLKMTDFDEMQFSDEDLGCPENGERTATDWIMCWTLKIKGSKKDVVMQTYGLGSQILETLNLIASSGVGGHNMCAGAAITLDSNDITYRMKCVGNECKIGWSIRILTCLVDSLSDSGIVRPVMLVHKGVWTFGVIAMKLLPGLYLAELTSSCISTLTIVKTKNGCINIRDFLARFLATGKLFVRVLEVQLNDITGLIGTFWVPSTCLMRSGWALRLRFSFAKSFGRKWGIAYVSPGIDVKAMFSTDIRKESVEVIMEPRFLLAWANLKEVANWMMWVIMENWMIDRSFATQVFLDCCLG